MQGPGFDSLLGDSFSLTGYEPCQRLTARNSDLDGWVVILCTRARNQGVVLSW